ncbi:MAG: class I SAM-dependent methyltransferase [Verrucomicrobiia bacterium]|jgi:SAM-dependent methyltransferase
MSPAKQQRTVLKDIWTNSPDYRRNYQTDGDIEAILGCLGLSTASGLVDIGCGNGAFSIAAAQRYPSCRVWAFDALESAVSECRAKAGDLLRANLSVGMAWAHSIPLGDAIADRALFRSVLHHLAEPPLVYREIGRLLKPAGLLVLQAPCNYWESSFAQVLSAVMMLMDETHRRFFYRPAEIVAGLQEAGFLVGEPECWTYSFPYLDDRQAQVVRDHRAQERLRLCQVEAGKWSIENYWVRVVATRRGA